MFLTKTVHVATHQSFSHYSAGFLCEICLQRSAKFDIVVAILNSTQQPSYIFVMSFPPRDFVQIASNKPFNDHSGL